jgi:hypothetical protein
MLFHLFLPQDDERHPRYKQIFSLFTPFEVGYRRKQNRCEQESVGANDNLGFSDSIPFLIVTVGSMVPNDCSYFLPQHIEHP